MSIETVVEFHKKIAANVSKVIVGKEEVIDLLSIAFICNGHVLLEDVPGLGKTRLVRSFSKTIGSNFKRIQFTPDLLPSDLTGVNYYNQKHQDFEFREGPLFSNIVLADEINRATPRTQSSLLEAMEERQITVDGVTRKLSEPYMVLATQNPIETHGTFPLPEAQMDRFFMRLSIGYPSREEELLIVDRNINPDPIDLLQNVLASDELQTIRDTCLNIYMSEDVRSYLMDIVECTRKDPGLHYGVSPRGTIALYKGSQSYAAMNGREYVLPEDVRYMAKFILNHRIGIKSFAKKSRIYDGIEKILADIAVPVETYRRQV
ncbi:MAG: MoxR family ATPase [Eubacteriales bacterium]|nr:MoxR family ATPase [Eubacteriales bacterium]